MNKPVDLNVAELYNAKVYWPNSYLLLTFQRGPKTLLYSFGLMP